MYKCPHCESTHSKVHMVKPPRRMCYNCGRTYTVNEEAVTSADRDDDAPGVTIDGNSACAVAVDLERPTVEALFAACGLSRDDWSVERVRPGSHQSFYKVGDGSGPGHKVVTMYSLKAWLIRKVPVSCEWPLVQPAKVRQWSPKARPTRTGVKRAVIVPDGHFGFRRNLDTGQLTPMHDERVTSIVARYIRDTKPDLVVMLGDNLDLPDWSDKFLVTPDCQYLTQAAIDELATWIMSWRPYAGEVIYLEGNHEQRMPRAITRNCVAAWNLRRANCPDEWPAMSVPHLLGLDQMDVKWRGDYPKNKHWINSKLRSRHAEKLGSKPGQAVGRALDHVRCSVFFGHAHTVESAYTTHHAHDKIRTYGAHCYGTMARLDNWGPPSGAADVDWQQAFGVLDYLDDGSGIYHQQQVVIYDGRCIVDGKEYRADEPEAMEVAS